MSTPFLGEIQIFAFNFAPKGWAMCNGQLISIQQNQALFSLLGTTYGGNGVQNFALPNMQSRVPMHVSNSFPLGTVMGEEAHTLTVNEIPAHTHSLAATTTTADTATPTSAALAAATSKIYGSGVNASMAATALANTGGSQPHTNIQPYLVLNFCIALQGIFPSRN